MTDKRRVRKAYDDAVRKLERVCDKYRLTEDEKRRLLDTLAIGIMGASPNLGGLVETMCSMAQKQIENEDW